MAEIVIQSADGNREHYALEKDVTTIGRSRESDIFLPDQWLSRHHAEIRRKGEAWIIVDLNSKNGTLLSGQPAKGEVKLRPDDVITLGEHTLTYTEGAGAFEDFEKEPEGTRVFSAREMSDISTKPAIDPMELAGRMQELLDAQGADVDILAASIRDPGELAELAIRGVASATVAPAILERLLDSDATTRDALVFTTDARSVADA